MARIRIAFFLDVMREDFDGVSITMHQIIRRIPRDGIEPIFITPQPPEKDFDYPVYKCPYLDVPFLLKDYRYGLPKRMKELETVLNDFKPDLIHFSSPTSMGAYAVRYAESHSLPITTIYHTHYPSFANYYLRYIPKIETITEVLAYKLFTLYRESTRVFAPTKSMQEYLLGKGVADEQIRIWGRGVEAERFNPSFRDDNFCPEVGPGVKKVLFVSRLVKEKEPNTLIRLYKLLAENRPDIRMIITGDGPTRDKLEKNMPEAVFTGKLVGNELSKAYASSDIFVFPSTTETFGNVVLEALASGLPVVAAAEGGPKDIVESGVSGFLVEPQNEMAFYDEIVRLVDDPIHYKKIQQGALEYARTQNWESLCDELFKTYFELTQNTSAN